MINPSTFIINMVVFILRKTVLAYLILFACVPTARLISQGAEVSLLLSDARQVEGELLSVRDSSLTLAANKGLSESDLATHSAMIIVVKNHEILNVIIKGKSNILNGIGQGVLLGSAIGGLIGLASGDDESGFLRFTAGQKALLFGSLLGATGLVAGTVRGIVTSTHDRMIEPLPNSDFSTLRPIARYRAGEPEFLKKIE